MRNLCLVGALVCLSACATVTLKPATLKTSLISEDSTLTKSAKAYQTQIEQAGWVEKTSALSYFQSKFFDMGETNDPGPADYAEKLMAEELSDDRFAAIVIGDIRSARIGLLNLNSTVRSVLSEADRTVSRRDVVTYEDALVTAGKARRSFSKAFDLLITNAPVIAGDVGNALQAFESEIDVSRALADEITLIWQGSNTEIN